MRATQSQATTPGALTAGEIRWSRYGPPLGRGLAEITSKLRDRSAAIAFDVSFSPGGEGIVFSLGSPDPGVYTAPAEGGDVEKLTDAEDHHANWGAAPGS